MGRLQVNAGVFPLITMVFVAAQRHCVDQTNTLVVRTGATRQCLFITDGRVRVGNHIRHRYRHGPFGVSTDRLHLVVRDQPRVAFLSKSHVLLREQFTRNMHFSYVHARESLRRFENVAGLRLVAGIIANFHAVFCGDALILLTGECNRFTYFFFVHHKVSGGHNVFERTLHGVQMVSVANSQPVSTGVLLNIDGVAVHARRWRSINHGFRRPVHVLRRAHCGFTLLTVEEEAPPGFILQVF